MSSSSSKSGEQPQLPPPSPVRIRKRRTEDEMRGALDSLASGKARQRDDEWEEILSDAIGEVIAWRRMGVDVMQRVALLNNDITTSIKAIGQ